MEEDDEEFMSRRDMKGEGGNLKGRKAEMLLFFFLAAALILSFYIVHCKAVVVIDGEMKRKYYTFSRTAEDLFKEKGLEVGDYDLVLPDKDKLLEKGQTIFIRRAFPVRLIANGKEREVWTSSLTVADFLQEKEIILEEEDLVSPPPQALLSPGMEIRVIRPVKDFRVERDAIPFSTIRVFNPHLKSGEVRVRQEGTEGILEKEVIITRVGDQELSREIAYSRVIKPSINRILEYGGYSTLTRGGRTFEFEEVLEVVATAYCPGTPDSGCPLDSRGASACTGVHNDGYTYTGIRAMAGDGTLENPHIIAVDPAVIPLKSLVYMEGYGFARAEDTGNAIVGNKIDLLFDTHEEALSFGKKRLRVYIIPEN